MNKDVTGMGKVIQSTHMHTSVSHANRKKMLQIQQHSFCLVFSTWKISGLDIPSHQSNILWLNFQVYLMQKNPLSILRRTVPLMSPFPLSDSTSLDPLHKRYSPPTHSKDHIRPRRSGPAQIQAREIVFPHLSFLPMNEALSEEE